LNARRLQCEYQWKQHVQIAKSTGISDQQVAALEAGNLSDAGIWSEEQRALLAFLDEVIAGPEVSDKVFTNARMWFSDRALVEVVTMQVSYNFLIERHNLRAVGFLL
jgi:alkylhydroperoxidase family enzyme